MFLSVKSSTPEALHSALICNLALIESSLQTAFSSAHKHSRLIVRPRNLHAELLLVKTETKDSMGSQNQTEQKVQYEHRGVLSLCSILHQCQHNATKSKRDNGWSVAADSGFGCDMLCFPLCCLLAAFCSKRVVAGIATMAVP